MEDKKVIRVRLSTGILCLIILLLIIGIVCMYIYFTNNENTDIQTNTVQINEVQNNINNQASLSQLDINSSIVTKLYNYIPIWDVDSPKTLNAYQDKAVTMIYMNEDYLLGYAFNQLNLSDNDKLPFENDDGTTMEPDSKWFSFKADILQEKVKELYGDNIKNQDFECGIAEGCRYTNGKYLHSQGGSWDHYKYGIRVITKAYETADELCIEDKYLSLVIDQTYGNEPPYVSYKLYTSSNCSNFVGNLEDSIIRKLENTTISKELEEIATTYDSKMVSYKHTFKKNDDGSYYWYSTEPIQ